MGKYSYARGITSYTTETHKSEEVTLFILSLMFIRKEGTCQRTAVERKNFH